MRGLVLLFLLTTILSGCASIGPEVYIKPFNIEKQQPKQPLINETSTYSHKYTYKINTNYKIRETKTSNIGATMIKVEDTVIEDMEENTIKDIVEYIVPNKVDKPTVDVKPSFKISNPIEVSGAFQIRKNSPVDVTTYKYDANSTFNIQGVLDDNGVKYYVINMNKSVFNFLVSKEGYFVTDKFLRPDGDHFHYIDIAMKTIPSEIKLDLITPFNQVAEKKRQEKDEKKYQVIDKKRFSPVVNYELIYGGKDSTGLHIVYREYTGDGIARQAFFQNLNYENKAKTIRFKNTNIEVVSADNEKIVFKVLEDDIFNLEKKGVDALPKNISTHTVKNK